VNPSTLSVEQRRALMALAAHPYPAALMASPHRTDGHRGFVLEDAADDLVAMGLAYVRLDFPLASYRVEYTITDKGLDVAREGGLL
jgi:hypothetical protein